MKVFKLLSYQFSKPGNPDHDWQILRTINSPEEYLAALKEGFLQDAKNRSRYPLDSMPIGRVIFDIDDALIDDGLYEPYELNVPNNVDLRLSDDSILIDSLNSEKEYMDMTNKFTKWVLKIRSIIPKMRKTKRETDQGIQDILKMREIAEKYGFRIEKM